MNHIICIFLGIGLLSPRFVFSQLQLLDSIKAKADFWHTIAGVDESGKLLYFGKSEADKRGIFQVDFSEKTLKPILLKQKNLENFLGQYLANNQYLSRASVLKLFSDSVTSLPLKRRGSQPGRLSSLSGAHNFYNPTNGRLVWMRTTWEPDHLMFNLATLKAKRKKFVLRRKQKIFEAGRAITNFSYNSLFTTKHYAISWKENPENPIIYFHNPSRKELFVYNTATDDLRVLPMANSRFEPVQDSIAFADAQKGHISRFFHYLTEVNNYTFLGYDSTQHLLFRSWAEAIDDTVKSDWRSKGRTCPVIITDDDKLRQLNLSRRPQWLQVIAPQTGELLVEQRLPPYTELVGLADGLLYLRRRNATGTGSTFYRARLELPQATVQE